MGDDSFLPFVYWNYDVFFLKDIELGRPFPNAFIIQIGAVKVDYKFHCKAAVDICIPLLTVTELLVEK
jgi:hypothetical protein